MQHLSLTNSEIGQRVPVPAGERVGSLTQGNCGQLTEARLKVSGSLFRTIRRERVTPRMRQFFFPSTKLFRTAPIGKARWNRKREPIIEPRGVMPARLCYELSL
jgi:hypothetical protein